jgi:nuclear polyadenylated RNA-binding protein 3
MTPDAPGFHTKSATPPSPVPFHSPEPSNIPVLRNQIDPVFNMTSTHIEVAGSTTSSTLISPLDQAADDGMTGDNELDASFSDPYDDEDKMADDSASKNTMEGAEVDDDYAKTFDSDGEESSSRQDVSSEIIDQKMQPPSAQVSVLADDSPSLTNPASTSTIVFPDGRDNPSSHKPSPPTATTAGDAPVAVGSTAAPLGIETLQSHPQFNSYEAVSSGEIDIQQILDDITANAALNATNSTNAIPTSVNPSTQNFSPSTLGLPAHASLPPRPQVAQNQPMHPAYPPQGDIRKYHAGPPNLPPPPTSSYRPLGAPASIVAAGAPGTSTDPRNVLPPPPSASFHPVSTGPPATMSYPQQPDHRLPAKDLSANSIETPAQADDYEMSWTPDVQKLYDEFLADERMYVSEGLWDRFPAGSRLFIGEHQITLNCVIIYLTRR